jgi:uncharacterized protein (TIGR03118 family)
MLSKSSLSVGVLALAALFGGAGNAQTNAYQQTNIISDGSVTAQHTDPTLINPWGVAIGQQTPFWINSQGGGVSIVANADGTKQFAVTIPPKAGSTTAGSPTGIVFNSSSSSFMLPGGSGAATFVFVTLDGTISGWNANTPNAVLALDNSAKHAVYTGLALGQRGTEPLLLAANSAQSRIDVFDSQFAPTTLAGTFTDPNLPAGYAPYGIHTIGNKVYVTYVQSPPTPGPPVTGTGLGYVSVYDMSGNFVARVASAGTLNAPWGVVLAPASFGAFGGDLLVGNFGDGTINAYDPVSFAAKGQLQDSTGKAIANSGLWDLVFGQQGTGDPGTLYFAAGINGEKGGLFGSLAPGQAAQQGDFTLAAASPTLTIAAGQSGSVALNLTPTGSFSGSVTFTCSGLPTVASCTFSPNPVTVSGNSTPTTMMTISTMPATGPGPYGTNLLHLPKFQLNDGPLLAAVFLPFGMGAVFFRRRLAQKRGLLVLAFVLLSGAMLVAVGCSSGTKSMTTPTSPQPTNFMVNVTATSGAISHSTVVTLTVN